MKIHAKPNNEIKDCNFLILFYEHMCYAACIIQCDDILFKTYMKPLDFLHGVFLTHFWPMTK